MKDLRAALQKKSVAPVDDNQLKRSIQNAMSAKKRGAYDEALRHQEEALSRVAALQIDGAFVKRKLTRFNQAYDRVVDPGLKAQMEKMGDAAAKALVARRYVDANQTLQKALMRMKAEGP